MNAIKGATKKFYSEDLLSTEISSGNSKRIFRSSSIPLAEAHTTPTNDTQLLVADDKGTVLNASIITNSTQRYSPYGLASKIFSLLAFNGERLDVQMGAYLLGSYRIYSPTLMRFCSPDNKSPFEIGGINSYAYCLNDPVNYTDPSGHVKLANKRQVIGGKVYSTKLGKNGELIERPLKEKDRTTLKRELAEAKMDLENPKYWLDRATEELKSAKSRYTQEQAAIKKIDNTPGRDRSPSKQAERRTHLSNLDEVVKKFVALESTIEKEKTRTANINELKQSSQNLIVKINELLRTT